MRRPSPVTHSFPDAFKRIPGETIFGAMTPAQNEFIDE
jgi:hypothetical protein